MATMHWRRAKGLIAVVSLFAVAVLLFEEMPRNNTSATRNNNGKICPLKFYAELSLCLCDLVVVPLLLPNRIEYSEVCNIL